MLKLSVPALKCARLLLLMFNVSVLYQCTSTLSTFIFDVKCSKSNTQQLMFLPPTFILHLISNVQKCNSHQLMFIPPPLSSPWLNLLHCSSITASYSILHKVVFDWKHCNTLKLHWLVLKNERVKLLKCWTLSVIYTFTALVSVALFSHCTAWFDVDQCTGRGWGTVRSNWKWTINQPS